VGAAVALALFASACAARRFAPPPDPPVPIPAAEAGPIWAEAVGACAGVRSIRAEVRPSGRIADTRVRGLTLFIGADAGGRIGIEAEGGRQLQFALKGPTDSATLWLPRERRYVTAAADRILHAIVGLDLDAGQMLALLSGCIATERTVQRMDRIGDILRATTPEAVVYLEQEDGRWTVRAGDLGALIVDYARWDGEWPRTIAIRTPAGRAPAVDLTLNVAERDINPDLPAAAFTVNLPPDAVQAQVEDLRLMGTE
jgi:hypothetical protein